MTKLLISTSDSTVFNQKLLKELLPKFIVTTEGGKNFIEYENGKLSHEFTMLCTVSRPVDDIFIQIGLYGPGGKLKNLYTVKVGAIDEKSFANLLKNSTSDFDKRIAKAEKDSK